MALQLNSKPFNKGSRAKKLLTNQASVCIWVRAQLALEVAGQCRHHHAARVAGVRVKRTRLTTTTHTTPTMGETNRA